MRCSLTSKLRQTTAAPVDYEHLSIPTSQIPIFPRFQCKPPDYESAKPMLYLRKSQQRAKNTHHPIYVSIPADNTIFRPSASARSNWLFLAADGDQHLKVEKTRTAQSTQIRFIRPNATQSGYSIHCNRFTARQFLPFGAGLLRRWTITALDYYGAGLLRRWAITTLDHCESVQVLDFGNGSAIRFAVDSSMQVTEWVRFHRFQHPSEHDGDVVTPTC